MIWLLSATVLKQSYILILVSLFELVVDDWMGSDFFIAAQRHGKKWKTAPRTEDFADFQFFVLLALLEGEAVDCSIFQEATGWVETNLSTTLTKDSLPLQNQTRGNPEPCDRCWV